MLPSSRIAPKPCQTHEIRTPSMTQTSPTSLNLRWTSDALNHRQFIMVSKQLKAKLRGWVLTSTGALNRRPEPPKMWWFFSIFAQISLQRFICCGQSWMRGISSWVHEKSRVSSSLGCVHGGREEEEEDEHNRENRENVGAARVKEEEGGGGLTQNYWSAPPSLSLFLFLFQAVQYLAPLV